MDLTLKQRCGRKGLTMTQKEMDILYEKMSAEFDKAMQKKEYPKLAKLCYSFAYAFTKLFCRYFG